MDIWINIHLLKGFDSFNKPLSYLFLTLNTRQIQPGCHSDINEGLDKGSLISDDSLIAGRAKRGFRKPPEVLIWQNDRCLPVTRSHGFPLDRPWFGVQSILRHTFTFDIVVAFPAPQWIIALN
jgi:hypothetical protein